MRSCAVSVTKRMSALEIFNDSVQYVANRKHLRQRLKESKGR